MSKIVGIVTTIIGGALGLLLIANLLPVFFPALASVNDYLKNPATTTGDGTADSMLTIFPIVIGVVGLLVVVAWVLKAFGVNTQRFAGGGRGGRRFARRY